jgi:hypothetical protein
VLFRSIYINASSSTNPSALLGFGTWEAFGAGRVMVGFNASDTLFDTLEETGGSKDAIAVSHTHTFSGTTGDDSPDHTHLSNAVGLVNGTINWVGTGGTPYNNGNNTQTAGASTRHQHPFSGTTDSTGSSGANANLPPYITVRMWKRVS